MTQDELDRIVGRLPSARTLFYYFKDRYALMLLEEVVGQGRAVSELKTSRYGRLLQKPTVRKTLARIQGDRLARRDVQSIWQEPSLAYRLTLGQWPSRGEKWNRFWHQMGRPGVNLVLQMNLPQSHVRRMEQLLDEDRGSLRSNGHPVASGQHFTLAWSRIDLDLERREALIEEIQSDWVRDVKFYRTDVDPEFAAGWKAYFNECLRPYDRLWSEAMLAATIWLLRSELGMRRIFYYTFATGNQFKWLSTSVPPRSLYATLPRQFCFRQTHNGPLFLRDAPSRRVRRKMRDPDTTWFVLQF
jgi:hypothetical protein